MKRLFDLLRDRHWCTNTFYHLKLNDNRPVDIMGIEGALGYVTKKALSLDFLVRNSTSEFILVIKL